MTNPPRDREFVTCLTLRHMAALIAAADLARRHAPQYVADPLALHEGQHELKTTLDLLSPIFNQPAAADQLGLPLTVAERKDDPSVNRA